MTAIHRVLITGAAGYLAGFVIQRLRSRYALTLMDRVAPKAECADLPFLRADITSYDDVARACTGQDAVVHLVALVRERFDKPHGLFADVMVKGTWNVAEACVRQGARRLVNVSSIVAMGWPAETNRPYRVGEGTHFRAGDLYYALSKHLGEEIGQAYHQAHGLSVIHLRPGVIAGDGLNPGPQPPGAPRGPWFVYVDPRDIAQAVECALETDLSYGCYQIVAGRRDALFDWVTARRELGYCPEHNWPEIPENEVRV
jgi:nucleoside-diphosphate-sugar epimerase